MDTIGRQTADTADSYLRRKMVQDWIRDEMRATGLSPANHDLVRTLVEAVIDQVAQATGATPAEASLTTIRDHAECGALWGYFLGRSQAYRELASVIPIHDASDR